MSREIEADPVPFLPRYSVELCACGHSLDHRERPCKHPVYVEDEGRPVEKPCPCESGMRTDVALNRQMAMLMNGIAKIGMALQNLNALTLEAHNLEVTPDGKIISRGAPKNIITPR